MTDPRGKGIAQLLVLAPESDRGRRIQLRDEHMVVGREAACDVRFNDPHVSRTHAMLWQRGDAVYVEDLRSSGGTFVNGAAATAPRQLHAGDVLVFATVKARFEAAGAVDDETRAIPAETARAASRRQLAAQRHGGDFNAGREGYGPRLPERESSPSEIAAAKRRARRLICTGLAAFVVGFGVFAAAALGFLEHAGGGVRGGSAASMCALGPDVGGVPSGLLGFAMGALGALLLIVGIVLHVAATARRGRLDREHPLPVPSRVPGPR